MALKILSTLTLENVCITAEVEARIEGVEVFAVKIVLRDAYGVAESLRVNYLTLAEILYRLLDIGVVNKTQDIVVGHASLLLCYYHVFATFLDFQKMLKALILQGFTSLLKLTIFQKFQ